MEALFFWIFALGLVAFGLAVVLARNPVAAALSLAATFIFQAALYVTLEAFFLAAVQVIVYAGAVMVLFLFIIMLLDIKAETVSRVAYGRIFLAALLVGGLAFFYQRVITPLQHSQEVLHWTLGTWDQSARKVGALLFGMYGVPFLATSVLLLVATLGVVILSKKDLK